MRAVPSRPPHLVRVDRRRTLSCDALETDVLARLQATLRAQPWYSDRITRRPFRNAVLDAMRSTGRSIVLLGPMPFEPPPPFDEVFESIQMGTDDPQMRTLSGQAPTRQERMATIGLVLLGGLALLVVVPAIMGVLHGHGRAVATAALVVAACLGIGFGLILLLGRFQGDWFLVPAGVVVRRWRRRAREPLVLLTPRDTAALIRYVSTGKTTVLILELWRSDGRSWRRAVTEREAMTFLAAWRSDEPAPPIERVRELLCG